MIKLSNGKKIVDCAFYLLTEKGVHVFRVPPRLAEDLAELYPDNATDIEEIDGRHQLIILDRTQPPIVQEG